MNTGYKIATIQGISWMGGFKVLSKLFSLVRIAILARLLSPAQFGIFGIATIALAFFDTMSQTGIGVFLVQEKKRMREYLDSAFVVSIIRGLIIFIIVYVSAPIVANFFGSSESVDVIKLISFVALTRGFINPARVIFVKDLKFKWEFEFSMVIFLVDAIVSVLATYILRSSEGIVWGLIVGAIAEVCMSYIFIKERPKFGFDKTKIFRLYSQGRWITGTSILTYFFEQGPDLFIGRLFSTTYLGIYQAAYRISTAPIIEIVRMINQVTFPVYVNLMSDTLRLKSAVIKTSFSIMALLVAFGILLHLFAFWVVRLILGNNWLEVVPFLRVLIIYSLLRAFIISLNPFFYAVRKQEYITQVTFVGFCVFMVSVIPLMKLFGVFGSVYALTLASIASLPVIYYYLRKGLL